MDLEYAVNALSYATRNDTFSKERQHKDKDKRRKDSTSLALLDKTT